MMIALAIGACVPDPAYRRNAPAPESAPPSTTPAPSALAAATPAGSLVRPTPTPGPSFATYKIKKGDTLSKIAKKYKTDANSISYWNRVTYPSLDPESSKYRPDKLEVGWILMILPSQKVDPEDLPTLSPRPTPTPRATPVPSASPSA